MKFPFMQFLGSALLIISCLPASGAALILDDFTYETSAEARQAWVATSAPQVEVMGWSFNRVMKLPCDFTTRSNRCYWDRAVTLDLSAYTDFALEVDAPDPSAISWFTLYFKSGAGWYAASAEFTAPGSQTLRFSKASFTTEGSPAGWNQITGIRFSPWKAASRDTYLAASQFRASTPPLLLVRDHESPNATTVDQVINRHLTWFRKYGIECGVISRTNVENGMLLQSRIAILPYNENISTAEWTALESFVAAGGKLLVYYVLHSRMEPLLGIRGTGWAQGDYARWIFNDPSIAGLPDSVDQASWNIRFAVPSGTLNSRVTATWADSAGQPTGRAAWLSSDNGYFVSHILLGDDADKKAYTLLCMIGHLLPEVWESASALAIEAIGAVGPYTSYDIAAAEIHAAAQNTLRAGIAEAELDAAAAARIQAITAANATNHAQAVTFAEVARIHMKQAFYASRKPLAPEFRALWEHHPTGPYPGNWPAAMDALVTNGFNAVFPNMLWGGSADYNSACLPHSADYAAYGDQIAACVNAAHAKGVQVHVWKVNWNLGHSPQSFIDAMRAAGRTQVSKSGQPMDWLCPSHPDNFALETNSMLEVARNYDVDGLHFDYIRYPNSDHCYCSGCGARFQEQTGNSVTNWPAGVLAAGALRTAFLDWRRAQITRLVADVHAGAKAIKPGIKISAAVFSDASYAYDSVGQDWRQWVADGLLDFICPMNYSTSYSYFTNITTQQLGYVNGRIPLYPGIGAYVLEPDGFIAQLEAARSMNTGGFIAFELSTSAVNKMFPAARMGALADDEPDTDNDLLPDAWELFWFENLASASASGNADNDSLTDRQEYILGADPSLPGAGLVLSATISNSAVRVSFPASAVAETGYRNAERHYALESKPLSGGSWESVPGFADVTVSLPATTLTHACPPNDPARLYRVRVWLQQKSP